MPVTINHTTLADGTFSATGAAAWDAAHSLAGLGAGVETALGNAVNGAGGLITFGAYAPASGKTLTVSNSLTLAGADGSTLNVGAGGTLGALATVSAGTGVATAAANAVNASGGLVTVTAGTTFQLPVDNGANTYVLQTNGSGVTSWVAQSSGITIGQSLALSAGAALC